MKPISYYQNITGVEKEHSNRVGSAYWNEGKWKNYIKPLLPTENREDMTFIDIGANSGLFCKLAEDAGFRNVIGIEKDKGAIKRGLDWKPDKYRYTLLNREVGENFTFDELPLADVVLLSNVHYYFQLQDWLNLLDDMYHRTAYSLMITRPIYRAKHHWRPRTPISHTKLYYSEWEQVKAKYKARLRHMEKKEDPSPRELHAMLFKSKLRRISIEELHPGAPGHKLKLSRDELITTAMEKEDFDIKETEYYKVWVNRMQSTWDEKRTYEFVKEKVDLIKDIQENGLRQPILISMDYKIVDGGHRIAILKALGYKSVICRMI